MITLVEFDQYIIDHYRLTIDPFLNKNLNYQEVALERYQELLVKGGPKTNFYSLKNDLELWNILTGKLELTSTYIVLNEELMNDFSELHELINDNIEWCSSYSENALSSSSGSNWSLGI